MSLINARTLSLIRSVTFVTTILFSLIVLSLSADLVSVTAPSYFTFSAFSLATGLISLLTVAPMYIIDSLRSGSFFSYIIVEIGCFSVLWIFWLTSGSYAAWTDNQIISIIPEESSCNFGGLFADGPLDFAGATRFCHEIKAITAVSFLLWILIIGYTNILIVLGIRAHKNGQPLWRTSVRDSTILQVSEGDVTVAGPTQIVAPPPSIPQPQTYPPAQQQVPPLPSQRVVVF